MIDTVSAPPVSEPGVASAWDARHRVDDPRWLLIALACMGVHQIQSAIDAPEERTFRSITLAIAALLPIASRLPRRARGILYLAVGLPPFGGALGNHILTIIRDRRVPVSTETAPLNLAGAALLLALGVALVRSPDADPVPERGGHDEARREA